eukprot:10228749-Prorocentrum_lima.AAC.1
MTSSLVGSEMCIRDRSIGRQFVTTGGIHGPALAPSPRPHPTAQGRAISVSYTHLTLPTICSV